MAGSGNGFLARICDACLEAIPVDGAAVTVMNGTGEWGIAYSSDDVVSCLEEAGFTLGEGPCLDAFEEHGPVLIGNLSREAIGRWPWYSAAAAEAGYKSVFAFPLQLGALAVGVMALYGAAPTRLDEKQLSLSLQMADAATLGLLDIVGHASPDGQQTPLGGDDTLPDPGFYQAEVYQASGMIMMQLDVPIADAMARLRAFAFSHERSVADVARDVLLRRLRFAADGE
jgi:hypothetical protein